MQITLPAEFEQFVSEQVRNGQYASEADVIADGLRLLRYREEIGSRRAEWLRAQIAAGVEEADRGELLDGCTVFERLRTKFPDTATPRS